MRDHYWRFILGLQYNAQRFYDDEISYYDISHPWCDHTCDTFLVRDFQNNTLLHDSLDHFIIYLAEQNIKNCSLYPFELLFSHNELNEHDSFNFVNTNYSVAVFHNNSSTSFALIQIEQEKPTRKIKPIGDPRDFWYPASSQGDSSYLLFTLVELNQQQRNECFYYDKNFNWKSLVENVQHDLLEHPFSVHISPEFELVNNLDFYRYSDAPFPFLDDSQQQSNIGFSLIEMLNGIKGNIHNLKQAKNENSPIHYFSAEEHQQLIDYEDRLSGSFINLICCTANNLKQANHISNDEKKLIKELQKKYPKAVYSYPTEEESNSTVETKTDEEPTNPWIALFALILLFAVLCGLLYVFYLLFNHFEFIKFAAITIGIIIFLAIWSNK